MTTVLVLVDLQEDYLAEPGLEPHRDAVVAGAAALLQGTRSHRVPVIHVHTRVREDPDDRMPHWKQAGRWQCLAGTAGQAPPALLAPRAGETILHKTGFGIATETLRAATGDYDQAVVAGVHLHACVRQAAIDLHQLGLQVFVANDAVASHEPAFAARTEAWMRLRGIHFLPVADIVDCYARTEPIPGPSRHSGDLVAQVVAAARMPAAGLQARIGILQAAAELVEEHAVALADLIVSEVAKPIRYARGEVARTAALFRAVARRASEAELEIREAEALVRYRPLGTVAVITPWNNPLAIAAGQLAPAFAYGNAIVWKPAPAGNRCAAALHRLLLEAGVESEALQMLTGAGDVGLALARQRGIDAVCFTGATSTGRMIAALCGDRNLPVQAELGGNNAAIVTAEADLDRAALLVAEAAFGSAGQRCTATRRVILLPEVYDRFSHLLEASTARLSWGDPQAEETQVGPLLNHEHAARVAAVVARAAAAGHRIVQPHLAGTAKAFDLPFYPPTIVFCDDPRAEIVQEEAFGPVLVVQRAHDLPDAFALQNGVRQGLAAALFSNSADEQQAFLATARAGILKLNQATVEAGVDVPFLGWKDSGIGPPQHGTANRTFFTRAQAVYGDAV